MMEVMGRPHHVEMWHQLAFGKSVDWDVLFADFAATVDWPAAARWRELAIIIPKPSAALGSSIRIMVAQHE